MYELQIAKPALKVLLKMPTGIAQRMHAELRKIATNPASYRGDWKRLQGSEFWRLRVGDWRAICEIREGELILLVLKVASRGDVYK